MEKNESLFENVYKQLASILRMKGIDNFRWGDIISEISIINPKILKIVYDQYKSSHYFNLTTTDTYISSVFGYDVLIDFYLLLEKLELNKEDIMYLFEKELRNIFIFKASAKTALKDKLGLLEGCKTKEDIELVLGRGYSIKTIKEVDKSWQEFRNKYFK
jgi:hypothetical protein